MKKIVFIITTLAAGLLLSGCNSQSEGKNKEVIERQHELMSSSYSSSAASAPDPDHILENYNIFDFELSGEEMKKMLELNTGKRYENW